MLIPQPASWPEYCTEVWGPVLQGAPAGHGHAHLQPCFTANAHLPWQRADGSAVAQLHTSHGVEQGSACTAPPALSSLRPSSKASCATLTGVPDGCALHSGRIQEQASHCERGAAFASTAAKPLTAGPSVRACSCGWPQHCPGSPLCCLPCKPELREQLQGGGKRQACHVHWLWQGRTCGCHGRSPCKF